MARATPNEAPVRRSFLIFGGIAVGAALIAFLLMTFVLGGDGGGGAETSDGTTPTTAPGAPAATVAPAPAATPKPSDPPGLKPGGENPFAIGADAQEVAVKPATVEKDTVKISVVKTYKNAADVKFGKFALEGIKEDQVLSDRFNVDEISGDCVFFKDDGERFKVCSGKSTER